MYNVGHSEKRETFLSEIYLRIYYYKRKFKISKTSKMYFDTSTYSEIQLFYYTESI